VFNKLVVGFFAMASLVSSACTIDVQGSGGGFAATVRDQKRLPLTGAGRPTVTVRTFNGSVAVRAWDRNEVVVDIEKQASTLEDAQKLVVETSEEDGNVLIEAKNERRERGFHFGSWRSPAVNLIITVPRELTVDARTADGSIDVRSVKGRIELRSGDGSIRLDEVEGDISVSTGDGLVMAREVQGTVAVRTGDGPVEMSGRFESLRAHTGDGAISIDAQPGSTMQGEWSITTGDGGVMIRLPEEFNAEVEARTGDGSITTTGLTELTPRQTDRPRNNLRARIGQGGEMLTIHTGDGSINPVAR
jgi:hypothetical protein